MSEFPYAPGDMDARYQWMQSLFPAYRFTSCPLVDTIASHNAAWEMIAEFRYGGSSSRFSAEDYRELRQLLFSCRRRLAELTPDHRLSPDELRAAMRALRNDIVQITLHGPTPRLAA